MNESISLYIHIPFCKQKCLYCDFHSYCGEESKMLSYARALSKEIDNIKEKTIKTIFIGGGTPTYLSLEGWNIIKESIDKLKKDEEIEFTVEGNPGTFREEKLKLFKEMGVNRLSIGLQAWQDIHLRSLGRIHSIEDFLDSFHMARKYGFDNINVDLMFGLPNQSFNEWKETLEKTVELKPEHISCYSLIIEEGTRFYEIYEEEKLNLPDEELERKMYSYTLDYLREKEYYQYEISNFCKKNKECKHNLVYWNLEEYVGLGAAAHSYEDGFRYSNATNVDKYITMMKEVNSGIVEKKKNTNKEDMEEFMFMGLRKTKGISIEKFNKKFKKSIFEIYGYIIEKYKKENLLIEEEGQLFLSAKGIEISNAIMSEFITDS